MANCNTLVQKVTFDLSDEQVTKVRVEIDFWGDCPHIMKRVYEKTFPARLSAVDILTMPRGEGGFLDYLFW